MDYIKEGVGLKENYEGGGLIRSAGGMDNVLNRRKENREIYDERILGDGTFVEGIIKKTESEEKKEAKVWDLNKIIAVVSKYYKKDKAEVLNSRMKGVRSARDLIIYLGVIYLGKSLTEMGELLGIRRSAASVAMYRIKERIEKEKGLIKDILNKMDNVP